MQNSFPFAHKAVGTNEQTLFFTQLKFVTLPYDLC